MTDWGKLITEAQIPNVKRERKKDYLEKTIFKSSLKDEETEGWSFHKDTKNEKKVKVRKPKPADEVFENRLWVLFADMGFSYLNQDRNFTIEYTLKGEKLSKQIDVFAADDETVLVIECKHAEKPGTNKQWKTELEAIHGYQNSIKKEILKRFPEHNVKFIFATDNYVIGEQDKIRMSEFSIAHFDDKTIKYYEELAKHLGSSARYQLLGALFANKKINGMDIRVPAIRGKMGGHTYYAFSIQPETLLKIGYVLHRNEANEGLMPTYQRVIKKARLKSVHDFIEKEHGFFPNSIVISLESDGPLQFDLANTQGTDDIAKCGVLHMPNKYRSAYIIDGQHRLYGYSDSKYAKTNSIPVVAFENLDQKEQVKLFMEINENQKAVSKNLRNTLNADLLWVSENPKERREALRSKIAQDLGDRQDSPLFNRVIIGEDQSDNYRCITLDSICNAIDDTNFLTKYGKDNSPVTYGIMDLDDNDKTLNLLEKYLLGCFGYLKELLPEEWDKNPKNDGILLFNNAIGGLIRFFADIANVLKARGMNPQSEKISFFNEETHYYLDPLQNFIRTMSIEQKEELRSQYGGNGPKHYWRTLQKALHEAHPEFHPDGYDKYWEDHGKTYNDESIGIMQNTEKECREFIKKVLTDEYGANWFNQIPVTSYTAASQEQARAKYDGRDQEIWDFFSMSTMRKIIIYGTNWSKYFEKFFTLPSEKKKSGGKKAKTEWMDEIDKMQRNIGRAGFSVSKDNYEILKEIENNIIPNMENVLR